jgi:hypothetical protein
MLTPRHLSLPPLTQSYAMTILTFLHLQLSRLLAKQPTHATGPKKPSLGQLESKPDPRVNRRVKP